MKIFYNLFNCLFPNLFSNNFCFTEYLLDSDVFPTLHSIPIAPINTLKLVPPADTNGIGMPVGGIEPVNTSYCIINL